MLFSVCNVVLLSSTQYWLSIEKNKQLYNILPNYYCDLCIFMSVRIELIQSACKNGSPKSQTKFGTWDGFLA